MGRTTRRTDRRRPPARRRVGGPGVLLGVLTLAVSGAGWVLLLAGGPSGDHTTLSMALGFSAFVGAALVAAVWAWRTRPDEHAPGWPPKALWQLPLVQIVLLALTVPVAYALEPGDHTIWGGIAVYGLLVPYGALLAWSLVWAVVVMPLSVLGRVAWFAVRREPVPEGDKAMLVLALILLPIVLLATGIVLGTPSGDKGDQTAAFFGAGDQSSPWLWVARGAAAFLAATLVGAYVYYRRVARTGAAEPAAPVTGD